MKKYKLAAKSYSEAKQALGRSSTFTKFVNKIAMKQAMCSYYQGNSKNAMIQLDDIIKYYNKFDPDDVKVQAKQIKSNFYYGKILLADGSLDFQKALENFSFCANDDIDPELHELYNGNALFEIYKIFIKQKDIFNAHEYI